MWVTEKVLPDLVLVYPLNDICFHDLRNLDCACWPTLHNEGFCRMITHNSFDQREVFEKEECYCYN